MKILESESSQNYAGQEQTGKTFDTQHLSLWKANQKPENITSYWLGCVIKSGENSEKLEPLYNANKPKTE